MSDEVEKKPKKLMEFYFSNSWYSFFTISYLVFFLYSALFYLDNLLLAIRFLFYTLGLSTSLLNLGYLFWGTAFIITLIVPFSVSISALFVFKNIWENEKLQLKQKFISTVFSTIIIITIIITMDDLIRNIASQVYLVDFAEKTHLLEKI